MTMRVQQSGPEIAAQARQTAREVAADVRQAQADARQAANDARQEAMRAGGEGTSVSTSVSPDGLTKTISFPNGRGGFSKIVIDQNGVQVGGDRIGSSTRSNGQRDIPPNVMELVKDFSIAACVILVGVPMVRGFWRWVERRGQTPAVQPEVMQRLSAIEEAVDAVAIEVERISEGQRFTTKLLSERTQAPAEEFVVSGARQPLERPRG